jgi:U3 small nucleolar RNA-associated protein 7
VRFIPYEDVLGIGHDLGYSSIVVPGAGEATFDAFEANPFATSR